MPLGAALYEPPSLRGAIVYFSKPENCLKYMAAKRWPNGVTCLSCVWLFTNCGNGVSSWEIHPALGVTQKTAWLMLHRVRPAMQDGPTGGKDALARVERAAGRGGSVMKTFLQFHEEAEFLRESSGSTNIEKTLLRAIKVWALFHIPHYVCGGFAVQEHGYPRFTVDVDIIVPDVEAAREKLCLNGFRENPGFKMTVTDRETKVEVALLPGGKKVDPGPLPFPMPTHASDQPQILTLEELISSKLSTYIGVGVQRAQDYADVVRLIEVNRLPREFGVHPKVRGEYHNIWDGLHQPKRAE